MDKKTFTIAIIALILMSGIASAFTYGSYLSRAFKIGDSKWIDLNQMGIGNGNIQDVWCSSNCSGFSNISGNGTDLYLTGNMTAKSIGGVIYADQYATIQDAVNKTGTILISSPLTITTPLNISSNTNIQCTQNAVITAGNALNSPIFRNNDQVNGNKNITISNCNFNLNGSGQTITTSLYFKKVSGLTVQNSFFDNAFSTYFHVAGDTPNDNYDIKILNNIFNSTTNHNTGDDAVMFGNGKRFVVTGNIINDAAYFGLSTGFSSDVTISNNVVRNSRIASLGSESSSRVTVTGNVFKDGERDGIYIMPWSGGGNGYERPHEWLVVDNIIENHQRNGIKIEEGAFIQVLDNQILTTSDEGIMVTGSDNITINDNTVRNSGNAIGNQRFGITINTVGGWRGSNNEYTILGNYLGDDRAIKFTKGINKDAGDYAIVKNNNLNNINQSLTIMNIIGTHNAVSDNFPLSPINHGNSATAPTAFGAGDTYFNSMKNSMCLYTTTWVYIGNSTGVC